MTMGIEHFRGLTTKGDIENRRVTIDQNTQEITAPKSLWGRFVNWIRGNENRGDRGQLNQHARETFYNALVKSSNPEFAEKVIKRVYGEQMTGETFSERTTNLQVSRIKQILDTARDMRRELRMDNERALEQYIRNGNLESVVETMARGEQSTLGHPLLKTNDPDVLREFRKLVRLDPDYRHRSFTEDGRQELNALARKAVVRALEIKKARFDEQYPQLAKIDTKQFHDSETFFNTLGNDLGDEGLWAQPILDGIKESGKVLGKMNFSREGAGQVRQDTVDALEQLQGLRDTAPEGMRLQSAVSDLVRNVAREALDHFEIKPTDENGLQLIVESIVNDFLGSLGDGESIEDKHVRERLLATLGTRLDERLIDILAPSDLVNQYHGLRTDLGRLGDAYQELQSSMRRLEEQKGELENLLRLQKEDDDKPTVNKSTFDQKQDQRARERRTNRIKALEQSIPRLELQVKEAIERNGDLGALEVRIEELQRRLDELGGQIVDGTSEDRDRLVDAFREDFETRLINSPDLEGLRQCAKLDSLQYQLERECDNQIAKLQAKIDYLDNYLDDDPRGEKSVIQDKLIWQKAVHNELQQVHDELTKEKNELQALFDQRDEIVLSDEQAQRLVGFGPKMVDFTDRLNRISTAMQNVSVDIEGLEHQLESAPQPRDDEPLQILDEPQHQVGSDEYMRTQRAQLKQNRTEAVEILRDCLRDIGRESGRVGVMLDEARERVLSESRPSRSISNDIPVYRDGVTRTYVSEFDFNVEHFIESEQQLLRDWGDEKGLPNNVTDVPNMRVSRLKQVVSETDDEGNVTTREEVKSQVIQHGVLDTRDIGDPELRKNVAQQRAKQVVTLGTNLAPRDFLLEARRKSRDGDGQNKIVHVNIGLSTSDPSGRHLDRFDGQLLQHQIDAFESLSGEMPISVRFQDNEIIPVGNLNVEKPQDDNELILKLDDDSSDVGGIMRVDQDNSGDIVGLKDQMVSFDVDTISFSFAVSGSRTGSTRFDEHDRQNMIKLVGDLAIGSAPGGYVGGIVDELREWRDAEGTTETERRQIEDLIGKIQREVDTARELFTTGQYKNVEQDPYKMARTVMRVVDLAGEGLRLSGNNSMHMSMSEGSRTIDGGSKLDIEHKSQLIIEDMGGRMRPMQLDQSDENDQDRKIYNTVLTRSLEGETHGGLTGRRGVQDLRDISGRSRDIGALSYTSGITERERR